MCSTKTQISLRVRIKTLHPWLSKMRRVKIQIRRIFAQSDLNLRWCTFLDFAAHNMFFSAKPVDMSFCVKGHLIYMSVEWQAWIIIIMWMLKDTLDHTPILSRHTKFCYTSNHAEDMQRFLCHQRREIDLIKKRLTLLLLCTTNIF